MFTAYIFLAISFHQRIWKNTTEGAEQRFILEPFRWVDIAHFFCSFIYSLSKYLLTAYYMAGTTLGDEEMIESEQDKVFT